MGMQVSRGHCAKVPKQEGFWKGPCGAGTHVATVVPSEGDRIAGREGSNGPRAHAAQRSTEVQHCDGNRLPEGEECDTYPSGCAENARNLVWTSVLVTRLLREHRGPG